MKKINEKVCAINIDNVAKTAVILYVIFMEVYNSNSS